MLGSICKCYLPGEEAHFKLIAASFISDSRGHDMYQRITLIAIENPSQFGCHGAAASVDPDILDGSLLNMPFRQLLWGSHRSNPSSSLPQNALVLDSLF